MLSFDVMKVIDDLTVSTPVKAGDVLVENVLGTGVSIIACKNAEN